MTRKRVLYPTLFILTYCLGLLFFIPDQYLEKKVISLTANKIQWQSFSRNVCSVELENVSLKNSPSSSIIASKIVIKPAYFSILTGTLAAAFKVHADVGTLNIDAKKHEKKQWQLDFDGKTTDISPFLATYLDKMPLGGGNNLNTKKNPHHENIFNLTGTMTIDTAGMVITSGEWQAESPLIRAVDIHFNNVLVNSSIVDNKMDVTVLSEGDLEVQADLQTNLQLLDPSKSILTGIINVQPNKDNPNSLAGLFFTDPKARRIKVSGNIINPKFSF